MDAELITTPVEIPRRTFLAGLVALPGVLRASSGDNYDFIKLPRQVGKIFGGKESCIQHIRVACRGMFSGNQDADPPEPLAPIWRWEFEIKFISDVALADRRAWFVEFFGEQPKVADLVHIPMDRWYWSTDTILSAVVEMPRSTDG